MDYKELLRHRARAETDSQRRSWDVIWLLTTPFDAEGRCLTVREVARLVGLNRRMVLMIQDEYDRNGAQSFMRGYTRRRAGRRSSPLFPRGRGRPPTLSREQEAQLMAALGQPAAPSGRSWDVHAVTEYVNAVFGYGVSEGTARKYLKQARSHRHGSKERKGRDDG